MRPTVSAIIPTWNEAANVTAAVRHAQLAGADEVVVADGASTDGTAQLAQGLPCQVVTSRRGRAVQQNAGAAAATGDVLLFLHADTWLAPGAIESLRHVVARSDVVAGSFRQRIAAPGWRYRVLETGNNLRGRRFQRPYGDQGLFVRREVFRELGGFPIVRLLEDLLLVRQLARRGRLVQLPGPIYVSPRRWRERGLVRQTLRNWSILTAHRCGITPNRLADWYSR